MALYNVRVSFIIVVSFIQNVKHEFIYFFKDINKNKRLLFSLPNIKVYPILFPTFPICVYPQEPYTTTNPRFYYSCDNRVIHNHETHTFQLVLVTNWNLKSSIAYYCYYSFATCD